MHDLFGIKFPASIDVYHWHPDENPFTISLMN